MAIKKDPNSLLLKNLENRKSKFKRNPDLDRLLEELEGYLSPVENELEESLPDPKLPPLFLVGNPRSGTSLFMQLISSTGAFAVPTNLLSRFYYAPFIGGKIQELLTNRKYDYKGEIFINDPNTNVRESDFGKTKGLLAPSEFFHFWRRFIPRYDPQFLSEKDCDKINIPGLKKGISAIEKVFQKPFAAKAIILQYNLNILRQAFPKSLIVYIKRNPLYIMQSILTARDSFYQSRGIWWSVKPKEYDKLKDMDFYHQIAGQVFYTEKALEEQLTHISDPHKLVVEYEAFCSDTHKTFTKIKQHYNNFGYKLAVNKKFPRSLEARNEVRIKSSEISRLEKAYYYFKSQ